MEMMSLIRRGWWAALVLSACNSSPPASTTCGGAGQTCCAMSMCNGSLTCTGGTCSSSGGTDAGGGGDDSGGGGMCGWTMPGTACMTCLARAVADGGCDSQLRVCERNTTCGMHLPVLEMCLCGAADAAAAAACIGTFETNVGMSLGGPELGMCATNNCAMDCGR